MVLDLGGGTVDITLQEVLWNESLKLLGSPSGGDWGGVGIDDAFYSLIGKLVGTEVFEEFKTQNIHDWIHLQGDFERENRKIKMEDDYSMMIQLPIALINTHKQTLRIFLREVVKQTRWDTKLDLFDNVLELKQCILKDFFDRNINDIIAHFEGIFDQSGIHGLNSILLVGGFAESSMVSTRITNHFKSKKVIVPNEAGSAVLKGAVIYGHNPNAISARVSPYTYALHTRKPYNPKIHDEHRMKRVNGKCVITNAYDKHIEVDEVVSVAEELKKHNFYVVDSNNPDVFWNVYRSSKKDPIYCEEEGCEKIGTLKIKIQGGGTPSGEKRELGVRMVCRGTELKAEARDKKTGKIFIATYDFLKR